MLAQFNPFAVLLVSQLRLLSIFFMSYILYILRNGFLLLSTPSSPLLSLLLLITICLSCCVWICASPFSLLYYPLSSSINLSLNSVNSYGKYQQNKAQVLLPLSSKVKQTTTHFFDFYFSFPTGSRLVSHSVCKISGYTLSKKSTKSITSWHLLRIFSPIFWQF